MKGVVVGRVLLVTLLALSLGGQSACGEGRTFTERSGGGDSASGGEAHAGSGADEAEGGMGAVTGSVDSGATGGESGEGGAGGVAEVPEQDLCVGVACDTPPPASCESETSFRTFDSIGTCTSGTCSYVSRLIPCTCEGDSCVSDPCVGVACSSPPATSCKDQRTATSYAATGSCSLGSCSYTATDTACPGNNSCSGAGVCSLCKSDTSCGASCTACGGNTTKCKDLGTSSQCVACLSDGDCGNGKRCVVASNTCVALKADGAACSADIECASSSCGGLCCPLGTSCDCTQPSAGNLLTNPGFDSNINSWNAESGGSDVFSWANEALSDRSCPYSGTIRLATNLAAGAVSSQFYQCVSLTPNNTSTFYFGAAMRNGNGDGGAACPLAECFLQWTDGSCFSNLGSPITIQTSSASWVDSPLGPLTKPAGATGARVGCLVRAPTSASGACMVGFDNLSLTQAPAKY